MECLNGDPETKRAETQAGLVVLSVILGFVACAFALAGVFGVIPHDASAVMWFFSFAAWMGCWFARVSVGRTRDE